MRTVELQILFFNKSITVLVVQYLKVVVPVAMLIPESDVNPL